MKLLIVIPALDEEAAIEDIIRRCLAARSEIVRRTPVREVEVCVVSDGSTDRTVEIARRHLPDIALIVFDENQGYGAAIQTAWRASDAELLGFLDADGTCDPRFFSDLVLALEGRGAHIAIGGRIHPDSRMPRLRRLGNRFFAFLLRLFSARPVRDTASGMRVIRRDCLERLLPLPRGLSFTPAMSARAMLTDDLILVEAPMPYHERAGRSKLSVVRDGLGFLSVILRMALLYRPSRPLGLAALCLFLAAAALMVRPALHYLQLQRVEEWMIYRFITAEVLGLTALLLLGAGYIGHRVARLTLARDRGAGPPPGLLSAFFGWPGFWWLPAGLLAIALALVWSGLVEFLATGKVYEHWSRFVVASFLTMSAVILSVTKLLDYTVGLIARRLRYELSAGGPRDHA